MYIEDLKEHVGKKSLLNRLFTESDDPQSFVKKMFSTIFGTQFPGDGSVYDTVRLTLDAIYNLESLVFTRPIEVGNYIVATVELCEIKKNIAIFAAVAEVYHGWGTRVVTTSTAEIWLPNIKRRLQRSGELS